MRPSAVSASNSPRAEQAVLAGIHEDARERLVQLAVEWRVRERALQCERLGGVHPLHRPAAAPDLAPPIRFQLIAAVGLISFTAGASGVRAIR
jgi:hypothetical protein